MLHMSRKILIKKRYSHILRALNGTTWSCIIPCSSISFQRKSKKLGHIKVSDPFISSKQATQLSEFGQVLDSILIFSAIKGIIFNCVYKGKVNREMIIRFSDAYRRRSKSRIRSKLVLQGVLC